MRIRRWILEQQPHVFSRHSVGQVIIDESMRVLVIGIVKGQQTVRYYGTYSNKTRGQTPLIPDRIIRLPKPEPLPEKPPPAARKSSSSSAFTAFGRG